MFYHGCSVPPRCRAPRRSEANIRHLTMKRSKSCPPSLPSSIIYPCSTQVLCARLGPLPNKAPPPLLMSAASENSCSKRSTLRIDVVHVASGGHVTELLLDFTHTRMQVETLLTSRYGATCKIMYPTLRFPFDKVWTALANLGLNEERVLRVLFCAGPRTYDI